MPALIDDRGRLFGRVNVVDLIVVIALVGLVAFVFLRFANVGAEERTVMTTFRVERVRDATVVQFQPGDEVRDEAGVLLGTVQEIDVRRSVEEFPPEEVRDLVATGDTSPAEEAPTEGMEEMIPFESVLYSDVDILVEGTGEVSDGRVAISSLPLRVGTNLVIAGPTFQVRAQIWDVEVVD